MRSTYHEDFVDLFHRHFDRLFRYIHRLCGEKELAADIAQDAFLRLYRRGSPPDSPEAWLITVGTNLLRNARSGASRRHRLLEWARTRDGLPEAWRAAPPDADLEPGDRVRSALARMPERERCLLLLRAEGYRYRDMAAVLGVHDASVGTLLARAKKMFREFYEETIDAPR